MRSVNKKVSKLNCVTDFEIGKQNGLKLNYITNFKIGGQKVSKLNYKPDFKIGKQKGVLTKRITSRTKLIEFVSKLKACEIYMGAPYRYVNAYRVSCQLEEIRMAYTINQLARLSEVSTRTR